MSGKQEQKKAAPSAPEGAETVDQEAVLDGWAAANLSPDERQAAFDDASAEDRARMFAMLLDKYAHLSGQVDGLSETILELDLRGTEDDGACGVAAVRLRELVEKVDQAERSAAANKGVATRNATELFGAISTIAGAIAPDMELAPTDENESHHAHAIRLLGELETRAKIVVDGVEEIADERDQLKRSLSAQKGATTKTRNEVEQLKEASRPRALGKGESLGDMRVLLQLVDEADQVELAFSNGRTEIPGVPPVRLTGEPLVLRRGTLRLATESLQVTGPNTAKAPPSLAGFALVLDGEQVAWAPLSSPLSLGAGQTYELKDSVVFATR